MTYSDPNVTASRFLQTPQFVARRLQQLGDLRYLGTSLLTGRMNTTGGAVGYENVEGIFADAGPEIVTPGSEYTITTIAEGPAGVAKVTKWGKDTYVTDEAIARRSQNAGMDAVDKGLLKLVNSASVAIDAACISVVASAVVQTAAAAAVWTTGTPNILRDILKGVSAIRANNLGYNPNVLLVDDVAWSFLASDPTIAATMARESTTNPIYSGRFEVLAGLQVIHAPAANLPGAVGTVAFILDADQLGFIATENIGGGYQQAGPLVESKTMREDATDSWRIRARSNFVPVVTDPGAGFKLTGIAA